MPILAIAALLLSVAAARLTGNWSTSGRTSIDPEQMQSSDEIKGWMTLEQVASGFDIPQEQLYSRLSLPTDLPTSTELKEIEGLVEDFEITAVREVVDAYLLETTPELETDKLPDEPQIQAEVPAAVPTPVTTAAIEEHIPEPIGDGSGPEPLAEGDYLPGSEIKGRHTLQEIITYGQVPLPDLLEALALPPDVDLAITVKDLVGSGSLDSLETLRETVTALQRYKIGG